MSNAFRPNEAEIADKIAKIMSKSGASVEEREGCALRTSHAKAHGLVKGELQIADDLPPAGLDHARAPARLPRLG